MKWLGKLSKTDPESFKGKMYLLLFEKVLLGAIIATAFVVYDRYKEADAHKFQTDLIQLTQRLETERATAQQKLEQERAITQQTLERTKILGELIPLLRDPRGDPLARAYLLRSAVKTDVIDADGAVDLASDLFIDALTEEQFARVMSIVIPDGVPAIARQGVKLSGIWRKERKDPFFPRSMFEPENISEEMRKTLKQGRAWRRVLEDALPILDRVQSNELENTSAISNHLYGLFVLMNTGYLFEAQNLAQRKCRAVRLIGNISRMLLEDREATEQVSRELKGDHTSFDKIQLPTAVLSVLNNCSRELNDRLIDVPGSLAEPLARILVEPKTDERLPDQIQVWHYALQHEAGRLLSRMMNSRSAEEILVDFIGRFQGEATKPNTIDIRFMSRWDETLLRYAVGTLKNIESKKGEAALEQLIGLQDSTWQFYSSLKEDVEQALNALHQNIFLHPEKFSIKH